MNWKTSLDKWLTTEPDDGFQDWCEQVLSKISENLYYENQAWFNTMGGVCDNWLEKLFGRDTDIAAKIIERAFKIYYLKIYEKA